MIYLQLFLSFLQIGLFSFGGGYAAMPLIQDQVVTRYGWLSMAEFTDLITISQMTPGPIAVNSATFVGIRIGGVGGALVSNLGCILPSLIIVMTLAYFYTKYKNIAVIQGVLSGLRPAVVGLIAAAVASVGLTVFFPGGFHLASVQIPGILVALGIFLLSLILVFRKLHPIVVICLSGLLGIGAGFLGLM